jgi:hypothetical protein
MPRRPRSHLVPSLPTLLGLLLGVCAGSGCTGRGEDDGSADDASGATRPDGSAADGGTRSGGASSGGGGTAPAGGSPTVGGATSGGAGAVGAGGGALGGAASLGGGGSGGATSGGGAPPDGGAAPASGGAAAGGGVTATGGADGAGGVVGGAGGVDPGGTGGASPGAGSIATVATPLELAPAPGLVGPALKVDLDMSGRPTSEVTEPGYQAWPVTAGASLSQEFAGVTFTFTRVGPNGTELDSSWQKAAIQAPYYARLVGDGITIADGDAGSQLELTIRGLAAGEHSLLTWHNVTGNVTVGALTVSVDGATAVTGLAQSNNALSNTEAPTVYVPFTAQAGQDVVFLFSSTAMVQVDGFELDTPNLAAQAVDPVPADNDEHVDADSGALELSWTAADGAVSHDVYLGSDPNVVQAATHDAPEYRGNQRATAFGATGLTNIPRYYWRVDEIDAQGRATRGNVWYFRPRHLAFPGAEGYGRFAIGGRGGVVVHVTNLNDSGAGSFRDAVETDRGPRTIVFDVGGVVALGSRLSLTQPYVTVAGQTAPGKGIVFRAAPFGLSGAHDVTVRDVRVRLGHGTTYDGMGMAGADHSILDHCSISWTIDEAFSSRSGKNITLQRTLISECLNVAGHANYPAGTEHGYAASIGGDIGSFHHNLLAHCEGRNWSLAGGLDAAGDFAGRLDIFDNVVYNWGGRATDGGAHQVNFVNNYYRPGPATELFVALRAEYEDFPGTQQYYCAGNVMPGHFDENGQAQGCVVGSGQPQGYSAWVDSPWFPSYAEVHTAREAFENVLSDVGDTAPRLDDHDTRVVDETLHGTTTYSGSVSGKPGLPDSEADVGGYEDYPSESRAASWDSDGDGLPDFWEAAAGLDPGSASGDFTDANTDLEGDGYTELEEYLAFMAAPHRFTSLGEPVVVELAALFAGYTTSPTYSSSGAANGAVTISGGTATFTPDACGHAGFSVSVRDGDGHEMTRDVAVFVEAGGGTCP